MVKNQKYIFLYALILTLIVFNLGIFMGYLLESSRVNKINSMSFDAELEILDQMAQKEALNALNLDCNSLIEENIKFGDKIFQEALQIQKYEDANQISSSILFQHKRFDLLRTLFWMNSVEIKQKCNSTYHNVIYLYKYNNPSLEQKSEQKVFSNLLSELKQKEGDKIMLIPMSADNNISSIDLLIKEYKITELPAILIDEKIKITSLNSTAEIEKYLD
ncbi:Uncharacterised protein [uncultured archaeon]|nr:Uncharacterised protein [uncultured archaeon]